MMSGVAHSKDGLRRVTCAAGVAGGCAEQWAPHTSLNRPIGQDRKLGIVHSRLDVTKQIAHTTMPLSTTWCWPWSPEVYGSYSAAGGTGSRYDRACKGANALHREQPGQLGAT
jgi:hypothetical protein